MSLFPFFILAVTVSIFYGIKKRKKEQEQRELDEALKGLDSEVSKLTSDKVTGKDIDRVLNYLVESGSITSQEYYDIYSKSLPARKR